jgi:hypothetical protein
VWVVGWWWRGRERGEGRGGAGSDGEVFVQNFLINAEPLMLGLPSLCKIGLRMRRKVIDGMEVNPEWEGILRTDVTQAVLDAQIAAKGGLEGGGVRRVLIACRKTVRCLFLSKGLKKGL